LVLDASDGEEFELPWVSRRLGFGNVAEFGDEVVTVAVLELDR
jgi:hypothetical protein